MSHEQQPPATRRFDAVVVGAGFAGLYQLYRLRELGLSVRVVEAGGGVGGTWYWNRYPGARCDVRSLDYSYTFSPRLEREWVWSEKYATQPEILRYLEYVADRFDLRRDIDLGTRVTAAHFDEAHDRWMVRTDVGTRYDAQFLVMATGCLSASRVPDIPGLEDFGGDVLHTARWPEDGAHLGGRCVGVVGTGSSGVQVIPELAAEAAHLTVFQRTPASVLPAHNRPLTDEERRRARESAPWRRQAARTSSIGLDIPDPEYKVSEVDPQERRVTYQRHWDNGAVSALLLSYRDLLTDRQANATVIQFLREKIEQVVDDPDDARTLTPDRQPFGAKRPCLGTGYLEVYNRPGVDLVDVRADPIERITDTGLILGSGTRIDLDVLVFATGFDAMTGALTAMDIRGRHGEELREKWSAGPHNYLGLATSGFPNLFMITGPGSPSVLTNMVVAIEQHVEWVTDCVAYLRRHEIAAIEADRSAEEDWVHSLNASAAATLYPEGNSWYLGANVPGKPQVFMPYIRGLDTYSRICDDVAARNYAGFVLAADRDHAAAELRTS